MYTTESCTTSIAVSDYKKRYIDIPTFTEYCKACPNYDRLWSCPSYTFDVEAFWNQFQTLDLFAVKIIYNDNYAGKQFPDKQPKNLASAQSASLWTSCASTRIRV